MTFAAPVSRDNFFYNGELFVDVGNFNRHKRATVDEISSLLRPDVKKPKKATNGSPPKDQVGHWYEAQLIHYGLPPSKDKARAKMRLLEALNASRLNVPSNITKVESDLRKEYAAAERKAKAEYKASQGAVEKSGSHVTGKKRKQSETSGNANNININISLGNDFPRPYSDGNVTESRPPAKKTKTGSSNPKQDTRNTNNPSSSKPSEKTNIPKTVQSPSKAPKATKIPLQTARSSSLSERWRTDPTIGYGPINLATGQRYYKTTSGEVVLRDRDDPPPNVAKPAAAKKAPTKKEPTTPKASRVEQEPKAKPERKIKSEPKTQEALNVVKGAMAKKEAKVKKETSTANAPSLGLINGIYDISCPTVEEEWPTVSTDLTLTLALSGTTVWGAYDLGMFYGIIYLPGRPWEASDQPIPFTWRGREEGEGMMSFGEDCDGEISFLGNGEIEGWISVYGQCEFRGVRRVEAGTNVRSAGSMRGEWEGYNEDAYEMERVGRWH